MNRISLTLLLGLAVLSVGCSSNRNEPEKPKLTREQIKQQLAEQRIAKICHSVEKHLCVPGNLNLKNLDTAFEQMVAEQFKGVFEQQALGNPAMKKSKFLFPDDDWVFINSTNYELPAQINIGDEVFKQYTLEEIREQRITHFLDITKIEQYGPSYLFTWNRGMRAAFGETAVEYQNNDYRVESVTSIRSSSMGRNYMREKFAGVTCKDSTQFAYYLNMYQSGDCEHQSKQ